MSSPAAARLPSVDRVLNAPATRVLLERFGRTNVRDAVRAVQQELRAATELPRWANDPDGYAPALASRLDIDLGRGLLRVFNLTGTLVHTNFGRSIVGTATAEIGMVAASSTVALEYDLDAGARGDRDAHVEPLLRALTGAQAATVVNNNAAALVLVLNTLALGARVPVSRGELIEIGGSFRLPEMIVQSGCRIHEVGTTNRTHPADFERAIDADTPLLLKVHPSNYRIEGFTRAPTVAELATVAHAHRVPLCVDLGSGTLIDMERFGLPHEPTVRETLAQGADIVTFSGDKLLGSVQAGIIAGNAELIARIKRNPLRRALRCDKVRLAMLRHTLTLYADPARLAGEVPLIRMLATPLDTLERHACMVADAVAARLDQRYRVSVQPSDCELGSGALPRTAMPSRAVRIEADTDRDLTTLARCMRALPAPVIGRLNDGALLLDMRALLDPAPLLQALADLSVP
jgi:L-seryl-tRNA(Ser) seleniumtransferase